MDNTDNQDLSLNGNTLSLTNDGTTVDLSGYLDNTDNQNISGSGLTGTVLTIGIQNGTSETVDLSSLTDADWYKVGTTAAPTNINDDIFTQGKVGIGISSLTESVNIINSGPTGHHIALYTSGDTDHWSIMKRPSTFSTSPNEFHIAYNDGTNWHSYFTITPNGNTGIGTQTPTEKLEVQGSIKIVDGTQGAGKILTSDANGKASWQYSGVPAGAVMAFNLATCPTGWAPADGTGGMPDLRGEFVRGLDNGRGVDVGRTLGSWQPASKVSYISNTSPDCPGCGTLGAAWSDAVWGTTEATWENVTTSQLGGPQGWLAMGASHQVTKHSGSTRPRNVAFLYCIKQ